MKGSRCKRWYGWLLLLAMLLTTGCARPWSDAFIQRSEHYIISSNDSPQTAAAIADIMESAFLRYSELLGSPTAPLPELRVNAYAARSQYRAVARQFGITASSTGLYSPVPPAAIHLPVRAPLTDQSVATLRHEGLHQFVDQFFFYEVPESARSTLSPQRQRLMALPLWLNEGLAIEVENPGSRNERLKYLQNLIRAGQCPPLHGILTRRYGEAFSPADYAAAWGVVHLLAEQQPRQLQRYLQLCRNGLTVQTNTGLTDHFDTSLPATEFYRRWLDILARRSPTLFVQFFIASPQSLAQWEKDWQLAINSIEPELLLQ